MQVERLEKLCEVLNAVNVQQFNLANWFNFEGVEDLEEQVNLNECGTQACAVGWACTIPEFNEQGLHAYQNEPRYTENERLYKSWHAVEKFFGLSEYISRYLFDPDCYRENALPIDVMYRIRSVVNNHKPKGN